jgi:hypothetical protein
VVAPGPWLVASFATLCWLAIVAGSARAQVRREPKATPTPDATIEHIDALAAGLNDMRTDLATMHTDVTGLASSIDALSGGLADVKGIAEPMREEVRGLYVEISNVRGEIARLEQSSTAYTEALGRSRYVLTFLLVVTAVLQLVVLAVLLRRR